MMQETQLNGESLDMVSENVSKLKELFPEIVTEDKIDFDKLKEVLGKYTEDDNERYNFTWKGKSAALRLAQTPSMGTLRPCKDESKNWDTTENLYIEGDNLEVLKLLQKSYYGKIKMIYIDPPYNTGKEFVYSDNYKDNLQNYLEMTEQVDSEGAKISTNSDTSGRYHTNWLNMMYPRLRLARNLLTEDGVIFLSIDDNEVDNIKKMCNEVFGEENFIAQFVWKSKAGGDARAVTGVSTDHEYILVYYKQRIFAFKGVEKDIKKFSNPDNDSRGLWRSADMTGLASREARPNLHYDLINPETKIVYACPPLGWAYSKDTMAKKIEEKRVVWPKNDKGRPRHKLFLSEISMFKAIPSVITNISTGDGTKEIKSLFNDRIFSFPKPTKLIKLLIEQVCHENSLIMDFFSGSSTTADATMQLNVEDNGNRKFILMQLPEPTSEKDEAYKAGFKNICEIGKERIRRAGDKIVSEMNQNGQTSLDSKSNTDLDIGFKVFKLDSSNLSKWDPEYDNLEQTLLDSVENLFPGRNELDLVYEIMLKYGIDLTLPIEEYPIKDKKFYSIGFGALIICLDDNLTSNLTSEIIKLKDNLSPEVMRVVFKDNGFVSDSDKTNIKETLKTNGIEEFVTI